MSEPILAVDLGGTHLRAALARGDAPAEISPLGAWPAPAARDEFLAALARHLAENKTMRLGLGVPGLVEGSVCRFVPNLPYLDGLDIAASLPGVETTVGNDAQFSLLAEASAGAAVSLSDAILIAIGTGIGSGVLADGRIVAGAHGGACSFGFAAATLEDACDDGAGSLERIASGRALDRIAAGLGFRGGAALIERARKDDADAISALRGPMKSLGAALSGAVGLLDPAVVIFAGGVSAALDVLAPLIRPALIKRLPAHLRAVELKSAHFGTNAGLVGAAIAGARGAGWRRAKR